jgi:DNA processing protein
MPAKPSQEKNLIYLNALNVLTMAKVGVLSEINKKFKGDFERAWRSDMTRYIPRVRNHEGKLTAADWEKLKKKMNPEAEWKKLEREGITTLTITDKKYPKKLRQITDPPFLLYLRGSADAWKEKCFAVVGTRALSEYGRRSTPQITQGLARAGFTIVSGLAAGIDTLAHKTALEEKAKTVAVLGCGSDDTTIFPVQNLGLARKIIENGGAVITEYAPGVHGTKFTFPLRNRIISGLSVGTLVVEADIISGAMITARCALDQNRDVFAVPGNIFAKTSEGTNSLIKRGAKLVACAEDILEDYGIDAKSATNNIRADNEFEEKILAALAHGDSKTADQLISETGFEPAKISATLMIMELGKKVKNLGNGRFVLNK